MKKKNFDWYLRTYRFNEKIDRKFTNFGKFVCIVAVALLLFVNMRTSNLFLMFSIALAMILADTLSLSGRLPKIEMTRYLPESCQNRKRFSYNVTLTVRDTQRPLKGRLYFQEIAASPTPSFEVFDTTPEPGEERRNRFDRMMGYYRWKWLIQKNRGGDYPEVEIGLKQDSQVQTFSANFTPARRGRIGFSGAYIYKKGLFGIFKKGIIIENYSSFVALPEIIPFDTGSIFQTGGSSGGEKTRETQETGSGFELKSLRDFMPGDSLRNIHWKSSAKSGTLKTKEFYKDVDAGSLFFIDNSFPGRYFEDFEPLLSGAASLLFQLDSENRLPQLLMIGEEIFETPENAPKPLNELLNLLAFAEGSPVKIDNNVKLKEIIGNNSSNVFFFTPVYDDARYDAAERIAAAGTGVSLFYTGERLTRKGQIFYEKRL